MNTTLIVNGGEKAYPGDIQNLEQMLLFVMERGKRPEDIVVEVKVDRKTFSEDYPRQARDIRLDRISSVEIALVSKEKFALAFMEEAPRCIGHLQNGFKSAIDLLRKSERQEQGHDMMARSLDMLRTLKCHSDNARDVLGGLDASSGAREFWERFDKLTDRINDAQVEVNPALIANLLEAEMLPFLEDWKRLD